MLGQCQKHGYYRGPDCPTCHQVGRQLMRDEEIERVGRLMAGILRHFPERFDLELDRRGWVQVDDFVDAVKAKRRGYDRWLQRRHIIAMASTDEKGRYQVDQNMIRATYGHSIEVNLDDLPSVDKRFLYFPTSEEELELVLEDGLTPHDRSMVHLSATPDRAYEAGRVRMSYPLLLEIDVQESEAAGHRILQAGKEVYITDAIPASCVKEFDDETVLEDLRERFGWGDEEE